MTRLYQLLLILSSTDRPGKVNRSLADILLRQLTSRDNQFIHYEASKE